MDQQQIPSMVAATIPATSYLTTEMFIFHTSQQNELLRDIQQRVKETNGRVNTLETNHAVLQNSVDNAKDTKARWIGGVTAVLMILAEVARWYFGG